MCSAKICYYALVTSIGWAIFKLRWIAFDLRGELITQSHFLRFEQDSTVINFHLITISPVEWIMERDLLRITVWCEFSHLKLFVWHSCGAIRKRSIRALAYKNAIHSYHNVIFESHFEQSCTLCWRSNAKKICVPLPPSSKQSIPICNFDNDNQQFGHFRSYRASLTCQI